MTLTQKEKADRYDALQTAIRHYIKYYQREAKKEVPETDPAAVQGFKMGTRQAAEQFADLLGRWMG